MCLLLFSTQRGMNNTQIFENFIVHAGVTRSGSCKVGRQRARTGCFVGVGVQGGVFLGSRGGRGGRRNFADGSTWTPAAAAERRRGVRWM